MAAHLDPEGRRELVRLMLDDGLSPRAAAARMGVSESTARRWRARADELRDPGDAMALAEASIREARALMDSMLAPVAPRAPHPRPARPRPISRPALVERIPARVRALRATRRQAGGLALTMAFIPAGWILSAAVFGGAEAVRPLVAGAPAPVATQSFAPELATARGRAKGTTLAAHVRGRTVALHRRPGGKRTGRLRARRIEGKRIPLVLLVKRRRNGWLRVHLPVRPNGSLAWIRASDARLRVNPYRVEVSLRRHRLTVWRYGRRMLSRKVGVGQALAPTPTGRYFVTDLIKARDPRGLYGPYAFGLSGFSPVHTTFGTGNGQIGIHGTNQPEALGTDVSQGCIRIGNATVTALARVLPLGTPVDVRRD